MNQSAPTLHTPRLILTGFSLDHWEAYAAAWADPALTAFIGGQPRTRHESWIRFAQTLGLWQLLGYSYWAFVDRESGAFLGSGGLAQFERGIAELEGFPEAGWALVPTAWGRGLATEAMAEILEGADQELAAEVRCIIDPENLPSQRVAEKLGFRAFALAENALGKITVYRRPFTPSGG